MPKQLRSVVEHPRRRCSTTDRSCFGIGAVRLVPGRGQACETNSLAAAIAEACDLATSPSFRVDATVMSLSPDAIVTWLSTPWARVWVKPIEFGTPTSYEATGALAILDLSLIHIS